MEYDAGKLRNAFGAKAEAPCELEGALSSPQIHIPGCAEGLAALAVIFYHRRDLLSGDFFAHGYLAVDFFFMLSGFVIAHAYEDKLLSGMSFGDFFARRLKRLLPLVFVGALLGLSADVLRGLWKNNPALVSDALYVFPFSALALPNPPTRFFDAFGVNPVVWSLFFEIIANVLYALCIRRLSNKVLAMVIIASGAALVAISINFNGIEVGNHYITIQLGIVRVIFPFSVGVLLYRLRRASWSSLGGVAATFVAVALAGVLLAPVDSPAANYLFDLVAVMAVFPALVMIGSQVRAFGSKANHVMETSGTLSYAVYMLHLPLLGALHFPLARFEASVPMKFVVYLATILPFAYAATFFYDKPVQAVLNRRRRASVN